MKLRPYQLQAVGRIHAELVDNRSTLLVLPTGCGKTIVFCDVIKHYIERGERALVLAHRDELLSQAASKLLSYGVSDIAVEKAKQRAHGQSVVVASVQTLRGARLSRFAGENRFGLIVVDESHHATAKQYRTILDHFASAKVLGVTATPDRLDGQALGQVFESVAYQYAIKDAIRDGFLVPIRSKRVRVEGLDLRKVRTTAGDLNQGDLAEVLTAEKNLHEVAAPLVELAGARKTVVFTANVAHAEALAEVINRYRPDAARWLSGKLSDEKRKAILAAYRRGEFQFLANCALLTEGWDEPAVSCVALTRPTKSRALYAQMIGRGTRLHPGKKDLLVLDFTGNAGKHRLITTADVLAGKRIDDELVERARQIALESGVDDLEALEMAQASLFDDRNREHVTAVARFIAEDINPFLPPDVAVDNNGDTRPATDKQLYALRKLGLKPPEHLTLGQAAGILDGLAQRHQRGLSTIKQIQFLRRHGYPAPEEPNRAEATRLIGRALVRLRRREPAFQANHPAQERKAAI